MLIGSHVSMSGKKMLQGSAEEAHKYGESTFMIYTGAPQNTRRKNIEDLNIEKGQQAMKTYGLSNIVVHAPYLCASSADPCSIFLPLIETCDPINIHFTYPLLFFRFCLFCFLLYCFLS